LKRYPIFLLLAACLVVGCAHSGPPDPPAIADLLAQLERNPIGPGEAVHTFTNQGPAPAVFFVVTTPRWDEQDRFMVTE
jgi:hypothetical protein